MAVIETIERPDNDALGAAQLVENPGTQRSILRVILRGLLWVVALVSVAGGAIVWWYVYRPLPRLDGTAVVSGLQKDVAVERDRWGVPHIRANSLEDLAEAQGYVMAQDRLWQMDLLRRIARGQLSEILGPATVNFDKEFRTLQFGRAAERDLALADAESRGVLEAYARGVNQFIEQHGNQLPLEFSLLRYKPTPWQATDTLVISAPVRRDDGRSAGHRFHHHQAERLVPVDRKETRARPGQHLVLHLEVRFADVFHMASVHMRQHLRSSPT